MKSSNDLTIGVVQMHSAVAARDQNLQRASELVGEAVGRGAQFVVVPEFFNVEYFAQYRDYAYLDYAEERDGPTLEWASRTARSNSIWLSATILYRDKPGVFYDAMFLFDPDGAEVGKYLKTHPAAVYSLEKIYFRPGSKFPVFHIAGWNVGFMICYDTFFPEVARSLTLRGAELLVAPFAAPVHPVWRELHLMRAFENGCYVAVSNKVGVEGDWTFCGESLIATPGGDIQKVASSSKDDVLVETLEHSQVSYWRQRYPMLRDRRPDAYGAIVAATEDL